MLGIIFGAAGMVFVYYTVQTIFGPVDEEFYLRRPRCYTRFS